ncbi:DUF192 domain-containing protein [Microaerobacter geothermalis]|uniref:DUF192 domain-containing protein n=1 Tax=Microaerobacter geothermalis TaxID=674972 RepID=UPI001F15B1EA|nr:DUF192 domain-containing protein [Microaerobacter geothermalis]MCF6094183.1 DUF192 domain-containing protein [Microaerobacter geothermalis]
MNRITVINERTHKILGDRIIWANHFYTRLKGLLGKKELNKGEGICLIPCSSVHTFFMKIPLDVIFVKKKAEGKYQVIRWKEGITSGKVIFSKGADAVLELPTGTISRSHTMEGDIIRLLPSDKLPSV